MVRTVGMVIMTGMDGEDVPGVVGGKMANFQGRIGRYSKAIANEIQVETQWQKYLVYDLLMCLAVKHSHKGIAPYIPGDDDHDTHKSTRTSLSSTGSAKYRKLRNISRNADVFRHAMHDGAMIFEMYKNKTLTTPLNSDEIIESIKEIVTDNARYAEGLQMIEDYARP